MTNWQTKTIGELVDYEQPSKYLVKDTNYIEDGTPVLTANKAFVLGYTHETEGIYVASKDSPVIIFDDFTTDNKFVDFDFKVKSSAIKILTAKPSNALPRFVHGAMQLIKTEITEHKRRFISEYQFHPIDTPDLPEQERIVGVLEVWDEYIEKLEQKIALKEQLKKGLMQQLLTGKKRLAGFTEEWHNVKLLDLATIKKGEQRNKSTLSSQKIDPKSYPVINGGISPSGYTDEFNTESMTITISEGGNSCGFVNFIIEAFWCGGHCYKLTEKQDVDKYFLFSLLKLHESRIMSMRVGSGLPNIQKSTVERMKFHITSDYNEQVAVGAIINTLSEEVEQYKIVNEKIKLQKKYLLKNLISGTIRTSEDLKPLDTTRLERSVL